MLEKPLTEEEIQFMELFHDSVAMVENLIPINIDACHLWNDKCECVYVRPYQFSMLSYEYGYANDFKLSEKENWQKKIGAGQLFNISSRNTGKSFLGIDSDVPLTIIHYTSDESCISSFDEFHLRARTERVANLIESHKFFDMFQLQGAKDTINRGNHFRIQTRNGHIVKAANETISGKKVGKQFHGMHYKKFWYDEFSYATKEGTEKRIDSVSSIGSCERLFGIPDLQPNSPLGEILLNPRNRNWICRVPQMIREDWDEYVKAKLIAKHNGEYSLSYKLNVLAELVEGAEGRFDMKRIKENCYNEKKQIKQFEIAQANFGNFKTEIIIDRLPCKQVYICADCGSTDAPTEIILIFCSDTKFIYHYNITLHRLTIKEQAKIFAWLYNELGTAYIGLDCSSAEGRDLAEELRSLGIPSNDITEVKFNANIEVGFKKKDDGTLEVDENNKPQIREERQIDWACMELDKAFYEAKFDLPNDEKFFAEFTAYICKTISGRKQYASRINHDHLLQAFQVFGITHFKREYDTQKSSQRKKRTLGSI